MQVPVVRENRTTLTLPKDRSGLGITDLQIKLPVFHLKLLQSITSPLIEAKWVYFVRYWIGRKLSRILPEWSFLGANNKPHFHLLRTLLAFCCSFLEHLGKQKPNIEALQKEKFTTKTIYTILEQQKTVRPRAESRWSALGHNVA